MAGRTKPKRPKVNATGRNETPTTRFVRLDHGILRSNAFRSLSPNDRSLLIELAMLENGRNNGSLYLSVRDAAHRMGVADLKAATRSFDTLQELGLIELTIPASFRSGSSGLSRARCWRLPWLAGPGRKGPNWDFLKREPKPKSRERKRMERGLCALKRYAKAQSSGQIPVLDSDTLAQFAPKSASVPVVESNTPRTGNGGFLPNRTVRDSPTHTAVPWGVGEAITLVGWGQPGWGPSVSDWACAAMVGAAMPRNSTGEVV